jgi:hypothetical protein
VYIFFCGECIKKKVKNTLKDKREQNKKESLKFDEGKKSKKLEKGR